MVGSGFTKPSRTRSRSGRQVPSPEPEGRGSARSRNGKDSWLWRCNGTASKQFDLKPTGHNNSDQPNQAQFDKVKSLLTGTQAKAKQ